MVDEVRALRDDLPSGSVAVVAPDDRCDEISDALAAAGLEHGRAATTGLDQSLTVVPVSMVKGLELDAVVVVEPSRDRRQPERLTGTGCVRSTWR